MTDHQFSAEWCRAAAGRIAELEKRLAAAEAREQKDIAELQRLNRECVALLKRLAAAEAAARWLWPKVSDDAYDAAWDKWPWLDSEAAKGGRDE